jgi:hypothetical protein
MALTFFKSTILNKGSNTFHRFLNLKIDLTLVVEQANKLLYEILNPED